ncbi:MAG: SAF domain-containing protein [Nakamurella sp.]
MRTEPRLDAAALQPGLADRAASALLRLRPGGRRVRSLRRLIAVALLLAAGVMASISPTSATEGTDVLVSARDLPAGAILSAGDIKVRTVRTPPDGILAPQHRADLNGALLSSPVRRGEILTDARILGDRGPDPGPGRAAVPVPLADPTIAALLAPGMHVVLVWIPESDGWTEAAHEADVHSGSAHEPVAAAGGSPTVRVLAADAVVLSVPEPAGGSIGAVRNRVIVVGVPGDVADAVTAAAAAGSITIRFGP